MRIDQAFAEHCGRIRRHEPDNMSQSFEAIQTILFERSPYGAPDAIVQHDSRVVYLFLSDNDRSFGIRACWVRNLVAGPTTIVKADLENDIPPVLPSFFCNHPTGASMPLTDDLQIVWFEEGNGIALFERDSVLAVIPPWSGQDAFHGFARDCIHENQICWPLPDRPSLGRRIEQAKDFWLRLPHVDFRQQCLEGLTIRLQTQFGKPVETTAITLSGKLQIAIARHQTNAGDCWITHGLSLFPQPNVELAVPKSSSLRRIELGLRAAGNPWLSDRHEGLHLLAHMAGFPWRNWTWLGDAHHGEIQWRRRDGGVRPLKFELNADRELHGERNKVRVRGDVVNLLWLSLESQ